MAKRPAASSAPRSGKRAATAAAQANVFEAELRLLAEAELPESCQRMLEAMIPHVWSTPEPERHQHQVRLVAAFDDIFVGVLRQKEEALNASKTSVEDAQTVVATVAEQMTAAVAEAVRKQELADFAEKQAEGATAARLAAARLAMQAIKTEQVEVGEKLAQVEKDKAVTEVVSSSAWGPIKCDNLTGKEKENAIKMLQQAFKTYGLGDTFTSALALAVKAGGDDREDFATAIVEFGDAALQKKISSHAASISVLSGAKEQFGAKVREAEAELSSATEAHSLVEDVMIAAQNILLHAREQQESAEEAKAKADKHVHEADEAMTWAQTQLAATQALMAGVGKHEVLALDTVVSVLPRKWPQLEARGSRDEDGAAVEPDMAEDGARADKA